MILITSIDDIGQTILVLAALTGKNYRLVFFPCRNEKNILCLF